MRFIMTYEKWDIVLVPCPFTNLKITKKRPALIISPSEFNQEFGAVIIMFITSDISVHKRIGDYHIKKWKEAGLPKPSMSRMKLATIDQRIIVRKFGHLPELDQTTLQEKLVDFFSNK